MFLGWRILFPGEKPPVAGAPVAATISTLGGQLRISDAFRIEFPAGAFPSDTAVTAVPLADPPPVKATVEGTEEIPLVGQAYDINVSQPLVKPATIVLSYADLSLPAGVKPADLKALHYHDGDWFMLPTLIYPEAKELRAEADGFSPVGVGILVGMSIIGGAVVTRKFALGEAQYSARYLQPELVDQDESRFVVEKDPGSVIDKPRIRLSKDVRVYDRGQVFPTYASDMEKDPKGMCIDFAPYIASVLIKRGYPVRVVTGKATYWWQQNNTTVGNGQGHQWVEAVIDGKPYYVNTAPTPAEVEVRKDPVSDETYQVVTYQRGFELVPLEDIGVADLDRRREIDLSRNLMFWKEKKQDGSYETHTRTGYVVDWWKQYVGNRWMVESSHKRGGPASTPFSKPGVTFEIAMRNGSVQTKAVTDVYGTTRQLTMKGAGSWGPPPASAAPGDGWTTTLTATGTCTEPDGLWASYVTATAIWVDNNGQHAAVIGSADIDCSKGAASTPVTWIFPDGAKSQGRPLEITVSAGDTNGSDSWVYQYVWQP